MALNMFSNFFQDKTIGVDPAQDQAPSIYSSPEEWASFRALQELTRQSMLNAAGQGAGGGRGGQGGASFAQAPAQAPIDSSGVVGPTGDTLAALMASFAPQPTAAPTKGTVNSTLQSDGSRDIYGVNAAEGGNRVNKNTAEFGVKATQDASGRVTLTNVGVPQGSYSQQGKPTAQMPTVSNDLYASIRSLKETSDPDIARGLLGNIRESAAQKMASIQSEAMNFAASKLGVPFLETQLREAENADRSDPEWYPGIGDSPITAKIRSSLLTTRGSVDNEAKNYLMGNTTFASMNAAIKTAEEEAKRIEKIGDRKATISDNMLLRNEMKKDAKAEQAAAMRASLSPEEQRRLVVLNPSIGTEKDPDAQMMAFAATIERADKNPAMREALGATDQDLPIIAMQDNPHATALTIAKEKQLNPSAKQEEIEAKLMSIARAADSPNFAKNAVNRKFGPDKANSDEAKAYLNELTMSGVGLDAGGKKVQRSQKYAMALDMYRAEATDRFLGDTSSWKVNDPAFAEAQAKATKITGKADMQSVLTAYMEGSTSADSLARLGTFRMVAMGAASMNTRSLFGTPDTVLLDATIAEAARKAKVFESFLGSRIDSPFMMN